MKRAIDEFTRGEFNEEAADLTGGTARAFVVLRSRKALMRHWRRSGRWDAEVCQRPPIEVMKSWPAT